MSQFRNFSRRELAPEDRAGLAAALTTIYLEGMGCFPPNPKWDDRWWNKYFILYVPDDTSFIRISASEGESDFPGRFKIFFLNTNRQTVSWYRGKYAFRVTSVPEHLQPFLRQLTVAVHGIAAEPELKAELELQKAEEMAEQQKKYYEENKGRIDAERENNRKKMEQEEKERKEKAAKEELKQKFKLRKDDLVHASRVMKWKASAAELTSSTQNKEPIMTTSGTSDSDEEPTKIDKVLESARRGPEPDLCGTCAEKLGFCSHKGCRVVGCIKCFEEKFLVCSYCPSFVCYQHDADFNQCSGCAYHICKPCGGRNCRRCDGFACGNCFDCGYCDFPLDDEAYLNHDDFGNSYYGYNHFVLWEIDDVRERMSSALLT